MNNFEKQLNDLPKGRLSRKADLMIRQKLITAGMRQGFFNFNFFPTPVLRPVIAAVVILVLVFSGATSVYAYNSSEVTRASLLYPVKRGLESIEFRLTKTPEAKVKFHNKLAERRILEAQFLSNIAKVTAPEQTASSTDEIQSTELVYEDEFNDTLSDADNEIEEANESAEEIGDQTELNKSLAFLSDSHLNELEKIKALANGIGLGADDRTTDNIAIVLDRIKHRQQKIVRAISQFQGDLKKADENNSEEASTSLTITVENSQASSSPDIASSSLDRAINDIKDLEIELTQNQRVSSGQVKRLTERLNKKIFQAKNAIENGDLKKFNGLLRATEALTNNGQHFLREKKIEINENAPELLPPDNSGRRIRLPDNIMELRLKQEEQRNKLDEKLREEAKKAAEQKLETEKKNYENMLNESEINPLPPQADNNVDGLTGSSTIE